MSLENLLKPVIGNLPAFIKSAQALGANVIGLLDPYLASDRLQFIATAPPSGFSRPNDGAQPSPWPCVPSAYVMSGRGPVPLNATDGSM